MTFRVAVRRRELKLSRTSTSYRAKVSANGLSNASKRASRICCTRRQRGHRMHRGRRPEAPRPLTSARLARSGRRAAPAVAPCPERYRPPMRTPFAPWGPRPGELHAGHPLSRWSYDQRRIADRTPLGGDATLMI